MPVKKIILLIIISFVIHGVGAKAKVAPAKDSAEAALLMNKAKSVSGSNLAEGIRLLKQAQEKAKALKNTNLLWEALFLEGMFNFNDLLYSQSLNNFQECLVLAEQTKDLKKQAKSYNAIGRTFIYLGDYSSCLKSLFKGLSAAEKIHDLNLLSGLNIDIGLAYQDLKDHQNALKYLLQAKKIEIALKSESGVAIVSHNLGDVYRTLNQYEEAKDNYRESMKLNHKLQKYSLEATSTSDLANVMFEKEEYDSALFYKKKAVDMLEKANKQYFTDYCYALTSYGRMLVATNRMDNAQKYLTESNQCALLLDDKIYAEIYYKLRYLFYSKKGDYQKALTSLKELSVVKDSLAVESSNFDNQRVAIQYEFHQKVKEDSLQYQLSLSQQANKVSSYKIRMYLAITIGTLLLTLVGFFTNRFRLIQKRKRSSEIEKMRNEIAGDLHDDVGSALSSIQIISNMALKSCEHDPVLKESVGHISLLSDKVAHGIKDIVWTVNPVNDTIAALAQYLDRIARETLGYCDIRFVFMEKMKEPDKKILPRVRRDIIMIFKEAVNNVCKYSRTSRVDINFIQDKSKLKLTIKDFGKGFDKKEVLRGNGLNNMERRAVALGGSVSINSRENKGTEIALKIPLN